MVKAQYTFILLVLLLRSLGRHLDEQNYYLNRSTTLAGLREKEKGALGIWNMGIDVKKVGDSNSATNIMETRRATYT